MKLFTGIAISLSVLIGAEEITRPEIIFKEGTSLYYTGDIDFTPGKKQKYASSFKVTEVIRNGSHWFCNATMTYGMDGVPQKGTFLFQFACDSLNYYVLAQNRLFRQIDLIRKEGDRSTGDSIVYPLQMKVGDTLPDAWCKNVVNHSEGTTVSFFEYKHRKVESLDTLSLGCGSIPAFRIVSVQTSTSKVVSSISGKREVKESADVTEWFSPQFGVVKSQGKTDTYISVIGLDSYTGK